MCVYRLELAKDPHEWKGVHKIAADFGIPGQYKTIANCAQGKRSSKEYHQEHQKLTIAQETILEEFIWESVDQGFPMTIKQIEDYANLLLRSRVGPEYEPVGESWAGWFLD